MVTSRDARPHRSTRRLQRGRLAAVWRGLIGPEGFVALIETMRSSSEVKLENAVVFPCSERVLLRAELTVRGRVTGQTTTVLLVELITVHNGLIVEDEIFYFDTHAVLAVLGGS